MDTNVPDNSATPSGIRFLAAMLFLGGLFGIGLGIWLGIIAIQQAPATIVIAAGFVAIFAVCVWRGIELWQGKPSGHKWAKILFAAQIPVVSLPSFSYEFSTAFKLALLGGASEHPISINLGSTLSIYIAPEVPTSYYGVNLVAIIALAYLFFSKKPEA